MSHVAPRPNTIWAAVLLLASCSSGGADLIATTPCVSNHPLSAGGGIALLWGLWDVSLDPGSMSAVVVPIRSVEFTCNVTRFLQPPISSTNLMTVNIDPSSDFSKGYVAADIRLTHPFPGMDLYTGFDVRGVVVGDGSISGIEDPTVLYAGQNDLRLLNADGLTRWFNPTEFTTYGKLFGFTLGSRGTPSYDFTATLNGYRYFCDKLDEYESASEFFADPACPNPRGYFHSGSSLIRRYEIQFPVESGIPKFSFQYAVVASWEPPAVNPPGNIPGDFSVSANCAEAYAISSADSSNMYYVNEDQKGGNLRLAVQVFDRQGSTNASGVAGEIKAIVLETPNGLIPGNEVSFAGDELDKALLFQDDDSATYLLKVENPNLSGSGAFPVLIAVKSDNPDTYDSGITGFVFPENAALAAYLSASVKVESSHVGGWARTWGGEDDDSYGAVALGPDGSVYLTGWFVGAVDFDPGPGVDYLTSNGSDDVFLSKFAPDGDLLWARTWGAELWDSGHAVTVDQAGDVYVVGVFLGTVDFDPGSGIDFHMSNGYADVFLSKFDADGNYQWARTWGGVSTENDFAEAISEDGAGNIYVSGKFSGTVDFDPGPGTDYHSSNGGWDVSLSKFNSSGDFEWARTWGGPSPDGGWGVVACMSDNIYITGWFQQTVDLDPGPGTYLRTSNGDRDAFLSDFDSNGVFKWAKTWGGTGTDQGYLIAVDVYSDVYVEGDFNDIVDFDPGSGIDNRASNGSDDISLSKFDSGGNYKGTLTWGGPGGDYGGGVGVDNSGDIFVTGWFQATVDFDPGLGVENLTSNGSDDIFISKFNSSGQFQWARTLGGFGSEHGGCLVVDSSGNMFVDGHFNGSTDFDPGPGVEVHVPKGENDVFLMKLLPTGFW